MMASSPSKAHLLKKSTKSRKHSHADILPGSLPRPPSLEDLSLLTQPLSTEEASSRRSLLSPKETWKHQKDFEQRHALVWSLMRSYLSSDKKALQQSIVNHVEYTLAASRFNFNARVAYLATANSLRDRLMETWNDTVQHFESLDVKRVAYLSLEFLMGRTFRNALVNVDLEDNYTKAVHELGFDMDVLYEEEPDAALGNGGLGRLAACFLDSMATQDMPAWGYGIRYTYGIFEQVIVAGQQVEQPDYWLTHGNPWEIQRNDVSYPVRFYGHVHAIPSFSTSPTTSSLEAKEAGSTASSFVSSTKMLWDGGEVVEAMACDSPIPGYDTYTTLNLRLWKAAPSREFDLAEFNDGRYGAALEARQRAETITSVLYPNDSTYEGKELRLKQQYFFVSATLQDLMQRFFHTRCRCRSPRMIHEFASKNAIQLNDTHPSIAIPELFRLLMDEHGLSLQESWPIVEATFAYTNHTVLSEALETWEVTLLEHLLPRHLQIIYDINWEFMEMLRKKWPTHHLERMRRMSLVDEASPKSIRMAHLSIVCSHHVNGVAALHTEIIQHTLFQDFYELWPHKFVNITNGVTPHRWIQVANTPLSDLISQWLQSEDWLKDLTLLRELKRFHDDPDKQSEWTSVKLLAKRRLAALIFTKLNIVVPIQALFDVQVKRIHEYKRQLMNCLYCIHRYRWIKSKAPHLRHQDVVPRVVIWAGKAAPSYVMAKQIIKLMNDISRVVNNDPDIGDLFKVVFLPNYKVSLAEVIIPASDVSQHISLAGTEASGTSNMKFVMNGGLILGTMDGANVEIAQECGIENMFIFGTRAEDVARVRHDMCYHSVGEQGNLCSDLIGVFEMLRSGLFSTSDIVEPILDSLKPCNDRYLVTNVKAQAQVDECYRDQQAWVQRSINMTSGVGKFSSDRTIQEYARLIWGVKSTPLPDPRTNPRPSLAPCPPVEKEVEEDEEAARVDEQP